MVRIAPDHRWRYHASPPRIDANPAQSEELEPLSGTLLLQLTNLTRTTFMDLVVTELPFFKKNHTQDPIVHNKKLSSKLI